MRSLFWSVQLFVSVAFAWVFLIIGFGDRGDIHVDFVRDHIYSNLKALSGPYLDAKFKIRGERASQEKIVVLAIDEESIERVGQWPWSRMKMSKLLNLLMEFEPRVVAFDMVFSEREQRLPPNLDKALRSQNLGFLVDHYDGDKKLAKTFDNFREKVVLGWILGDAYRANEYWPPICDLQFEHCLNGLIDDEATRFGKIFKGFNQEFRSSPHVRFLVEDGNVPELSASVDSAGFFNSWNDPDGVIRRVPLVAFAGNRAYPSLGLAVVERATGERFEVEVDADQRIKSLVLNGRELPINERGDLEVNFGGGAGSFVYVPAVDILEPSTNREQLSSHLRDSIVFIGATAVGLKDIRSFPFARQIPGTEGHAWVAENILSGNYLYPLGFTWLWVIAGMMLIVGLVMTFALYRLRASLNIASVIGLLMAIYVLDQFVLFGQGLSANFFYAYVQVAVISLIGFGQRYVEEEGNRKYIANAFGRYVSKDVVNIIMKNPDALHLGGKRDNLSVLFSDVRSFTTISENMAPHELSKLLNDHLGRMTEIIVEDNKGTLDKFIGDAVMCFWGAPIPQKEHALLACKAAVEMQKAAQERLSYFKEKYGVEVQIGVGVNTGEVTVGNMGSEKNFNYTVIGDAVNLASRLEGLTKSYGAGVIISEATFKAIPGFEKHFPHFRFLDRVKVKGKSKAVGILQIFTEPAPQKWIQVYHTARQVFQEGDFNKAIELFETANRLSNEMLGRNDVASLHMIERCFAGIESAEENFTGSRKISIE